MPFRAKVKRAFGGTSTPDGEKTEKPDKSFLNKTAVRRPLKRPDGTDWPDNVYKPGELMPRPKYRGPWNQAHQDKLSAFSFGSSSRRRRSSVATTGKGSDYSPMGSKLPSRGASRRGSAISWGSLKRNSTEKVPKRRGMGSRQTSGYGNDDRVDEGEEPDDVGNVGLSRQHTKDPKAPPPVTSHDRPEEERVAPSDEMHGLETQKTVTANGNGFLSGYTAELENQKTVTNGTPLFTEDELAKALTASTLKASRRERE